MTVFIIVRDTPDEGDVIEGISTVLLRAVTMVKDKDHRDLYIKEYPLGEVTAEVYSPLPALHVYTATGHLIATGVTND